MLSQQGGETQICELGRQHQDECVPKLSRGEEGACSLRLLAHLGVEHVDAEVAHSCLEEVVLGAVLQEGAVHGIGPHLQPQAAGTMSSGQPQPGPKEQWGTGLSPRMS